MNIAVIPELEELYNEAVRVFSAPISWEMKYDFIFPGICTRLLTLYPSFTWYDPDTSYEEDVSAFMRAFRGLIGELKKIGK
jgi:hypothetical protein